MSHENERRVARALQGKQKVHDKHPVFFVEIAGRLIGNEDRRVGCQGTRQRDALLFAAGEFCRIMVKTCGEPHGREFITGARLGARSPASSSGTATFSSAVIVGIR